ncbi:hypothetical protein CEP54_015696 [Fusarium duplospermum]|uniref:Uncharacterized protein n=1 Tax=Fusarium duplospermum TaxID=1325734 RepID=A0A428NM15_9HYPO|nr:hypothetical protein CEP54_015696 [Fusarium duplospermum]
MDRIFGNGSESHRTATWEPEPTRRGTFSILSICLVTLSLCVWTAVHLNIPSSEERSQDQPRGDSSEKWSWKSFRWTAQTLRKAGWMILGILAPELVLFTALQQFGDATALRDLPLDASEPRTDADLESSPDGGNRADRKPKCALVHGYFAAMGGFEFVTGDDYDVFPRKASGEKRTGLTVTPAGLRYLVNKTPVEIPKLRRSEIEDKSKGSALAKTLVCLQAFWFCTQCITRFTQNLTISLLELNTFGHALCALLMYCLWWYKPLDIGEPVQITVGKETADYAAAMGVASKLDYRYSEFDCFPGERHSELGRAYFGFGVETDNSNEIWIQGRGKKLKRDGISRILRLNKAKRMTNLILFVYIDANYELQIRIWKEGIMIEPQTQLVGSGTQRKYFQLDSVAPVTDDSLSFIELADRDTRRWELALLAFSKLSGQTDFSRYDFREVKDSLTDRRRNSPRFDGVRGSWPLYLVLSIIGSIYGGLHCLAWNAPFATDLERLLWRLSSVTVSSIGALILLVYTWELAPPIWKDLEDSINIAVINWIFHNMERMVDGILNPPWNHWINDIGGLSLLLGFLSLRVLYDVFIAGFILLYCLARVYLVVECFINLAHLPDSAYVLPKWSQYVPHIS